MTHRYVSSLVALFALCMLPSLSGQTGFADLDFDEVVDLEPFTVKAEPIQIEVKSHSGDGSGYAKDFGDDVLRAVYETVEGSPGNGLIIMGEENEPHPLTVFKDFIEWVSDQPDAEEMRPFVETVEAMEENLSEALSEMGGDELDLLALVEATPFALPNLMGEIYLMYWEEKFDSDRVRERVVDIGYGDLCERNYTANYDWVIFLTPKNKMVQVVRHEVLPTVIDGSDMGLFGKAMVRGALFAFGPALSDSIEAGRKGMVYGHFVEASQLFDEKQSEELVSAYIDALMPKGNIVSWNKDRRAIKAIRKLKRKYSKET